MDVLHTTFFNPFVSWATSQSNRYTHLSQSTTSPSLDVSSIILSFFRGKVMRILRSRCAKRTEARPHRFGGTVEIFSATQYPYSQQFYPVPSSAVPHQKVVDPGQRKQLGVLLQVSPHLSPVNPSQFQWYQGQGFLIPTLH